ncbi:patatin-like phospholipase family protein [Actinoplanes sp. GCM10030250]|uniref:patatin-like phospholipase family protein n=1 Tax=Actinoplanes sp. GCM10030250 TaxID=3273376 RepID=UPI00362272C4
MTKALVLGGGGVTGIAWELGVLCGLQRAGVPLGDADYVIGTSAGSVVGTVLTSGIDLGAAVAVQAQEAPPPRPGGRNGGNSVNGAMAAFAVLGDPSVPAEQSRMRVGAFALSAEVGAEEAYVSRISSLLPARDWPARELRIVAVDTADGREVVFDSTSGVPVDLAVAASCAVPGLMPPITINNKRYMDGGVRLGAGADLAAGAGHLVVIAPMAALDRDRIRREMASTGAAHTLLIEPDEAAAEAIGLNFMDPSRRAPSVHAGLRQGESLAEAVRAVWRG